MEGGQQESTSLKEESESQTSTSIKAIKLDENDSPRTNLKDKEEDDSTSPPPSDETEASNQLISNETKREIEDIATYAADRIIKDMTEKDESSLDTSCAKTNGENEIVKVGFRRFGEWYNTGGFSLVPWLELLDLAKWDYAGRAAASAKKKQQSESSQTKQNGNRDVSDVNKSMDNPLANIMSNNSQAHLSPTIPDLFLQSPSPQPGSQLMPPKVQSQSQVLVSFDFAGINKYRIDITTENLLQFKHLVTITDFASRSPVEVANVILRHSIKRPINMPTSIHPSGPDQENFVMVLSKNDFSKCIIDLMPVQVLRRMSKPEIDSIMNRFLSFFYCFSVNNSKSNLDAGLEFVNAKELAAGMSFFCSGNKSAKLASTFELIGDPNFAFISHSKLLQYFRSYLTMLAAISLLSSSEQKTLETIKAFLAMDRTQGRTVTDQVSRLYNIIEAGSLWTLDHFKHKCAAKNVFFEDLASWYTDGGFTIATWLEFLDVRKFLSLLHEKEHVSAAKRNIHQHEEVPINPPSASGGIRNFDECFSQSPPLSIRSSMKKSSRKGKGEVLFTFPLANKQSLVVLREDAAYVRSVVDHLGLLDLSPETVWSSLCEFVKNNPLRTISGKSQKNADPISFDIDQKTFVDAIHKVLPSDRIRPSAITSSPQEILQNFFQSFDLNQINRVPTNQLMGGLTLLCGGNKSAKLAFAFGLFDMRQQNGRKRKIKKIEKNEKSLCGKELFYFFRSFLIVMFSCCEQSLDLSAECVGRYISDSANKVTDDVMKYQWRVARSDRVSFDDFGEWYNEGGFETAPWLELLDLNKWVLLDKVKADQMIADAKPMRSKLKDKSNDLGAVIGSTPKKIQINLPPPPPPDDEIDPHSDDFFDDIEMDGIGGDIGDMGFLFSDKENVDLLHHSGTEIRSSEPSPYRTTVKVEESKSLKFQLFTNESTVYTVSVSQQRVLSLKHLVIESGLYNISITEACDSILKDHNGKQITRDKFNSAMNSIVNVSKMSKELQSQVSDLLSAIFSAFDNNKLGKADATELACGLTVLFGGRKSDKLEFAFDLLDKKKNRLLSRFQMVRYLQSFLLVLLNISSCNLGSNETENILYNQNGESAEGNMALARVICSASSWATEEIFHSTLCEKDIDFDKFADWYTRGGFNRIAWIELLDLKKWILV